MLTVDVHVNSRLVARAKVRNAGGPGDLADYDCAVRTEASQVTGNRATESEFRVERHARRQTPWALVARIAADAARREGAPGEAGGRAAGGPDAPDPSFEAVLADLGPNPGPKLTPLMHLLGMYRQDTVLAGTPLATCGYGNLFAYMHRRFGPSPIAGDARKQLCGGWLLETGHAGLYLWVTPALDGPEHSLQAVVADGGRLDALDDGVGGAMCDAYRRCLLDLLRPVPVRETHIDALGPVPRGSPSLDAGGTTAAPSSHGARPWREEAPEA